MKPQMVRVEIDSFVGRPDALADAFVRMAETHMPARRVGVRLWRWKVVLTLRRVTA